MHVIMFEILTRSDMCLRIALQRYLPAHIRPESYITSCMTCIPLVAKLAPLPPLAAPRKQLVALMYNLREQYNSWLLNPNLPFADVLGQPPFPTHRNPYAPMISNLGLIDRYVPQALPAGGPSSMNIVDFRLGHRLVHFHRP